MCISSLENENAKASTARTNDDLDECGDLDGWNKDNDEEICNNNHSGTDGRGDKPPRRPHNIIKTPDAEFFRSYEPNYSVHIFNDGRLICPASRFLLGQYTVHDR